MANSNEDSLNTPNPNHNANPTYIYIYVRSRDNSGDRFWSLIISLLISFEIKSDKISLISLLWKYLNEMQE